MTLLAEQAEDAREIAGLEAVDDVGGTWACLRHAHVERPVGAEGEAPLGLVDLHGRHADVEHDAVGFGDCFVEMRERAMHEPKPAGGFILRARAQLRSASGSRSIATTDAPAASSALV